MDKMHSLLKSQLQRNSREQLPSLKEWQTFLQSINEAYNKSDSDRAILEREHIQATNLMLKVREIALGIDSRISLGDVLNFVVESAMDIPGIHFVLVQKLDKSRKFVTTPYFSKPRNATMLKLLKTVGFNVDEYLGKSSTSDKLRFELAKLRVAQDYVQNPRTIVLDSLSEILGNIWPKPLCDSIQKIMNVKKFVITPLLIEGKSWGNLFFLLDGYVPQDALEMITAHCALGIKNTLIMKELADSEEKIRQTIEAVTEGIIATDINGYITDVNNATLKIHGYTSKQELIGNKFYELMAEQDILKSNGNIPNVLENEQSENFACKLVTRDRHVFDAELNTAGIRDKEGNTKGFVTSIRDITERKQAEKALQESEHKYSLIANSTVDYIAIMNMKGIFTYLSPSHRRLGYDPEAFVGRSGFDFMHPDDKQKIVPLLANYASFKIKDLLGLKQESFSENLSYRFSDIHGNWHYMEASVSLIESSDGKGMNILSISRDLTEKKQAEEDLRRQKDLIDRTLMVTPNAIAVVDSNCRLLLVNKIFETEFASKQKAKGRLLTENIVPPIIIEAVKCVASGKYNEQRIEYRTTGTDSSRTNVANVLNMGEEQALLMLTDVTSERERKIRCTLPSVSLQSVKWHQDRTRTQQSSD